MKKILFIIATLLILTNPSEGKAAIQSYKLLEPLPCIGTTQECVGGRVEQVDLKSYVGYIFKLVIALAGAIAVFRITWGGFKYMTTDAIFGKQEGKKEVKDAIYGLIMILASYLILRTIDPRLVNINTEIKPIEQAEYIDMNSLFTDVNESYAALDRARETDRQLAQQEVALREQRAIASSTEASDRLTQAIKKIEQQRARIAYDASLEARFEQVTRGLSTNNETTVSKEFKEATQSLINGVDITTRKNIQSLRDLGDIEGAEKLEQKRVYYVARGNDDLTYLETSKKLKDDISDMFAIGTSVRKFGTTLVDIENVVKAGDSYIADLKKKQQNFSNQDTTLTQEYVANIESQIKGVQTIIDPIRNWKENH